MYGGKDGIVTALDERFGTIDVRIGKRILHCNPKSLRGVMAGDEEALILH